METDYYKPLGLPKDPSEIEALTLERSTKWQTIFPDIDSRPYPAYESEVSRLPANINIGFSNVTLKDMGSANVTRLNGLRLEAHQEQVLQNGDILTFGKIKTQVLF